VYQTAWIPTVDAADEGAITRAMFAVYE